MTMLTKSDVKDIVDKISKMRRYASFCEKFSKRRKELAVVEELIEAMEVRGKKLYYSPRYSKKDPPDCIVKDQGGNDIGVEVTELVDKNTIEKYQKGFD